MRKKLITTSKDKQRDIINFLTFDRDKIMLLVIILSSLTRDLQSQHRYDDVTYRTHDVIQILRHECGKWRHRTYVQLFCRLKVAQEQYDFFLERFFVIQIFINIFSQLIYCIWVRILFLFSLNFSSLPLF